MGLSCYDPDSEMIEKIKSIVKRKKYRRMLFSIDFFGKRFKRILFSNDTNSISQSIFFSAEFLSKTIFRSDLIDHGLPCRLNSWNVATPTITGYQKLRWAKLGCTNSDPTCDSDFCNICSDRNMLFGGIWVIYKKTEILFLITLVPGFYFYKFVHPKQNKILKTVIIT